MDTIVREAEDLVTVLREAGGMSGMPKETLHRILAGKPVFLGAFERLPPMYLPGWIVQVRAARGRTWTFAVAVDETNHRYSCRVLDGVPWFYWAGDRGNQSRLYRGDVSQIARFLKDRARARCEAWPCGEDSYASDA